MLREEFPYRLSDFTVEIVPQPTTDGQMVYFASVDELLGCSSDGTTPEEARNNLEDAFELYVSTSLEDGVSLPKPIPTRSFKELVWTDFSGINAA